MSECHDYLEEEHKCRNDPTLHPTPLSFFGDFLLAHFFIFTVPFWFGVWCKFGKNAALLVISSHFLLKGVLWLVYYAVGRCRKYRIWYYLSSLLRLFIGFLILYFGYRSL